MNNNSRQLFRSLPKGEKVYLCLPNIVDNDEFLSAVQESVTLHYPWVEPPSDDRKYHTYIESIDLKTNIGFFIRTIDHNRLVGVINIGEIVFGVFQSGYLGFYGFKKSSGQGLISEGLSLVLDFYFNRLKLHRLEANIQPQNTKSIALVKSRGFRLEGFSPKYLNINGKWCDHERYALTLEDYKERINE